MAARLPRTAGAMVITMVVVVVAAPEAVAEEATAADIDKLT